MATSQLLQKNFSSSFSWCFFWQIAGRCNTASRSWSWKSFSASVLCSLLVRIMLCAKIHSSHQKEQHWKQYKVWALFLSQFPHFTLAVLHSLIVKTSSKLLIRKFVGSSLGFPLPGIWNCLLHSGHAILPWTTLVRWIPFRQLRQKLCKQGNCFGSVNVHIHTEQDSSSWRLSGKVFISMEKFGIEFEILYKACCWRYDILNRISKEPNPRNVLWPGPSNRLLPGLNFILSTNQTKSLALFDILI